MDNNFPDIFTQISTGCQPIEYAPGNIHKILQEALTGASDALQPGSKMEVTVICKDKEENLYAIRVKVENPDQ